MHKDGGVSDGQPTWPLELLKCWTNDTKTHTKALKFSLQFRSNLRISCRKRLPWCHRISLFISSLSKVTLQCGSALRGPALWLWALEVSCNFFSFKTENNLSTAEIVTINFIISVTFCWPCISVFNQLDAQNLFHNKFISCLYMFRAHVLIIRR